MTATDPAAPESIARPPTRFDRGFDVSFRALTRLAAWLAVVLTALIVAQIAGTARPAIQKHGLGFLTTDAWDPTRGEYGVRPQIAGTLYSSALGVSLGTLLGFSVAVMLTQEFLPRRPEVFLKNVVELLAAVPSVVYGLWGIFVVIPAVRPVADALHESLGFLGIFSTRLPGPGMLPAALVLAVMVLPTVSAVSRDALAAVPVRLREAAFGLGATRWQVILRVVLPEASRGLFGAVVLAFGRAVGETMALAMLLGNSNTFSWSLFAPGNSLAALMANQWPESGKAEKEALMFAGLVLLGITLAVNAAGAAILRRAAGAEVARR